MDCNKWFARSIVRLVRAKLMRAFSCRFGFKPGFCRDDFLAVIGQGLYLANRWRLPCAFGALDVAIAFGSTGRAMLSEAMVQRGLRPQFVRCLLSERSGFQASLRAGSWGHREVSRRPWG